jgi:pyridoxal phosphate enzyme (YggS family)
MHSLDSLELALELNKKLEIKSKKMNCLLQINSANEDTKSGFLYNEALTMYKKIQNECPNINLKGVMSIGANTNDKALIIKSFQLTKNIFDKLEDATICSMGMSGDFDIAILNGSNMIRVGSALFTKEN